MVKKGDELVAIVDGEDNILYVTERRIADRDGLRMRSARMLLFDPEVKRTFVHRRAKKPVNGGLIDVGTAETPHVYYDETRRLYLHESYRDAAGRGFFEEGTGSKGSLENMVNDTKYIAYLPSIDIPGSPRNYVVHGLVYNQDSHGMVILEREEIEEAWWKTEPELRYLLEGTDPNAPLMGIAPAVGQLALYIMRNPSLILDKIEININMNEVYAQ